MFFLNKDNMYSKNNGNEQSRRIRPQPILEGEEVNILSLGAGLKQDMTNMNINIVKNSNRNRSSNSFISCLTTDIFDDDSDDDDDDDGRDGGDYHVRNKNPKSTPVAATSTEVKRPISMTKYNNSPNSSNGIKVTKNKSNNMIIKQRIIKASKEAIKRIKLYQRYEDNHYNLRNRMNRDIYIILLESLSSSDDNGNDKDNANRKAASLASNAAIYAIIDIGLEDDKVMDIIIDIMLMTSISINNNKLNNKGSVSSYHHSHSHSHSHDSSNSSVSSRNSCSTYSYSEEDIFDNNPIINAVLGNNLGCFNYDCNYDNDDQYDDDHHNDHHDVDDTTLVTEDKKDAFNKEEDIFSDLIQLNEELNQNHKLLEQQLQRKKLLRNLNGSNQNQQNMSIEVMDNDEYNETLIFTDGHGHGIIQREEEDQESINVILNNNDKDSDTIISSSLKYDTNVNKNSSNDNDDNNITENNGLNNNKFQRKVHRKYLLNNITKKLINNDSNSSSRYNKAVYNNANEHKQCYKYDKEDTNHEILDQQSVEIMNTVRQRQSYRKSLSSNSMIDNNSCNCSDTVVMMQQTKVDSAQTISNGIDAIYDGQNQIIILATSQIVHTVPNNYSSSSSSSSSLNEEQIKTHCNKDKLNNTADTESTSTTTSYSLSNSNNDDDDNFFSISTDNEEDDEYEDNVTILSSIQPISQNTNEYDDSHQIITFTSNNNKKSISLNKLMLIPSIKLSYSNTSKNNKYYNLGTATTTTTTNTSTTKSSSLSHSIFKSFKRNINNILPKRDNEDHAYVSSLISSDTMINNSSRDNHNHNHNHASKHDGSYKNGTISTNTSSSSSASISNSTPFFDIPCNSNTFDNDNTVISPITTNNTFISSNASNLFDNMLSTTTTTATSSSFLLEKQYSKSVGTSWDIDDNESCNNIPFINPYDSAILQ